MNLVEDADAGIEELERDLAADDLRDVAELPLRHLLAAAHPAPARA